MLKTVSKISIDQTRMVYVWWICLIHDSAEREFPRLYCSLFFFLVRQSSYGCFYGTWSIIWNRYSKCNTDPDCWFLAFNTLFSWFSLLFVQFVYFCVCVHTKSQLRYADHNFKCSPLHAYHLNVAKARPQFSYSSPTKAPPQEWSPGAQTSSPIPIPHNHKAKGLTLAMANPTS